MFPNNSGDSLPALYLTFLHDIINVVEKGYNWRHIVLCFLYFNICRSCLQPMDCIARPLLLLQMWFWTQILIGRPREFIITYLNWGLSCIYVSYFNGTCVKLRSLHWEVLNLYWGLRSVSNGWQHTYSSTPYVKEDHVIFEINYKPWVIAVSIGCQMLFIRTICLGCTTRIKMCKFSKFNKLYLLNFLH
jgi:hypothetical protein